MLSFPSFSATQLLLSFTSPSFSLQYGTSCICNSYLHTNKDSFSSKFIPAAFITFSFPFSPSYPTIEIRYLSNLFYQIATSRTEGSRVHVVIQKENNKETKNHREELQNTGEASRAFVPSCSLPWQDFANRHVQQCSTC